MKDDKALLKQIFENAYVDNFQDGLNFLIKDVITELYSSNKNEILQLKLEHLDRACFKYKKACSKRTITNTKQYFKMCVLSAIKELHLDEPYFEDSSSLADIYSNFQ